MKGFRLAPEASADSAPADGAAFWKFPLVDKLAESSTTLVKVGDTRFYMAPLGRPLETGAQDSHRQ